MNQTSQPTPTDSEAHDRRGLAYHEAGHAVAAIWNELSFDYATIVAADDYDGCVHWGEWERHLDGLEPDERLVALDNHCLAYLAGYESGSRVSAVRPPAGLSDDSKRAFDIAAERCESSDEVVQYLGWMGARTAALFDKPEVKAGVSALADALMERHTIVYDDAVSIVKTAWQAYGDIGAAELRQRLGR